MSHFQEQEDKYEFCNFKSLNVTTILPFLNISLP